MRREESERLYLYRRAWRELLYNGGSLQRRGWCGERQDVRAAGDGVVFRIHGYLRPKGL